MILFIMTLLVQLMILRAVIQLDINLLILFFEKIQRVPHQINRRLPLNRPPLPLVLKLLEITHKLA